ncbi:MAG: Ferric iron ABC transporter, iron-binding protein [uncultured Frankineae bacterium]|uniref:Ferric iron ABC transporter, iron-binding protein n=1 Tax=uncultured Frankineae bacterium TaxID=437475 RepID=A0A6J4MAY7_9ACTN|nr:MAG: Ferric iron ABC transporter, iron-binding protein [uncultured Frankineae bacterium]
MPVSASRPLCAALAGLAVLPVLAGCGITASSGDEGPAIQVYSARTYGAEKAYERFTQETGVRVEFLNGSDAELRERLEAEGADSPADVYLTVDAANLSLAAEQDLLQPVRSTELEQAVPASLRDPQDRWYGLAERARVIIYDEDQVTPDQLSTYAALSDPAWKGGLCMRTSTSPYTQSLVASLVAHGGEAGAREVIDGWMANDPQILANDTEIIRTVDAGGCTVGITNHYYVAREEAKDPDLGVGVFFPDQAGNGTHVNISGAGVTRSADDVPRATQFLEWLATTGQSQFVDGNFEYPVNRSVEPVEALVEMGEFRRDELNVGELRRHNATAVQILTDAGYR